MACLIWTTVDRAQILHRKWREANSRFQITVVDAVTGCRLTLIKLVTVGEIIHWNVVVDILIGPDYPVFVIWSRTNRPIDLRIGQVTLST